MFVAILPRQLSSFTAISSYTAFYVLDVNYTDCII